MVQRIGRALRWTSNKKYALVIHVDFTSNTEPDARKTAMDTYLRGLVLQPVVQDAAPDPDNCEIFNLPGVPGSSGTVAHYLDYAHIRRAAKLDPGCDPAPAPADAPGPKTRDTDLPEAGGNGGPDVGAPRDSLEALQEVRVRIPLTTLSASTFYS